MRPLTDHALWITAAPSPSARESASLPANPWESGKEGWKDRRAPFPADAGLMLIFRDFHTEEPCAGASVTVTALGLYDLWCNGRRVGEVHDGATVYNEMCPGHTVFSRRAQATTYDLTPYLCRGDNRLLAVLSGGWYGGRISFGTYGFAPPCLWAEIVLPQADGSVARLSTDEGWMSAWDGPVLFSDIWDGELQDLRRSGYEALSQYGAVPAHAAPAVPVPGIGAEVTEQIGPQVRLRPEISPTPVQCVIWEGVSGDGTDFGRINALHVSDGFAPVHLSAGQHLQLDLGQNMVGRERLRIRGAAGVRVTVTYAEMKNDSGERSRGNDGPAGSLYVENYRSAKAKCEYILSGAKEGDLCMPRYGFCGFRYFEITADGDIFVTEAGAVVLGSDLREVGRLETSDPEVNRLLSNIRWGQRGNYLSIPTDCPQRDERLGWTGDTQVFCRAAAYQADVRGFFHKWMQDVRDSQGEDGYIPDVVPAVRIFAKDTAAAWGDAAVIVPYTIWQMYGDTAILTENMDCMERYMRWIAARPGCTGPVGRYLDWLAFEPTEGDYISMAYYAYDARLMAEMCRALGQTEAADGYAALRERIAAAFAAKHLGEDGLPLQHTQTAYVLALHFDLLAPEKRGAAADALCTKIRENGNRLSTGFVGTASLCQTLSECGRDGMAYTLLLQTECPSWLYSVRQGATTVWERWNSYTHETGFGDVNMNSFNHYAYGAVAEWIYRYMAGIDVDPATPGLSRILLHPRPDLRTSAEIPEGQNRITRADAALSLAGGELALCWETNEEGNLTCAVTVPQGHWASFSLPLCGAAVYTENGCRTKAPASEDGLLHRSLAPGHYVFCVEGVL